MGNADKLGMTNENGREEMPGTCMHPTNEVIFDDSQKSEDPYFMNEKNESVNNQADTQSGGYRDFREEYGSTGASDEYTATNEQAMQGKGYIKDYGQQLAAMNVEGMPWFEEMPDELEMARRKSESELNGKETLRVVISSMVAALLVAGVFILGAFLFILFCTNVWF